MAESSQHKLDRVRAPRVQITYDVETNGASSKKELPFIVGVMADLSGKPLKPLPKLKDRQFVNVDRDNFNDVLAGCAPRLAIKVDNKIKEDGSQLGVELKFSHMDDFLPQNVAEQVAPIKKMLAIRQRLTEMLARMDLKDDLAERLSEIVKDTDRLRAIVEATAATDTRDAG